MSTPDARVRRSGRYVLAGALAAAGIGVVLASRSVRAFEAVLGAAVSGVVTGTDTVAIEANQAFYWSAGTPEMFGLRVTSECTVAFILGPLLLAAAAVSLGRRLALRRIIGGTLAAVALVLGMNAARLGLIAWATHRYGVDEGYEWSHTVGGSMVSVVGLLVACAVFISVTFRGRTVTQ